MTLRVGSLFSGIGGLELGLEEALRDAGFDCETAWQCEADAWCRGILARHWPSAVRYDDVRGVGAGNAPRVDVLCGGFPCQDVSYAGKGAGLAGERSGLWYEFARIVRELRPRIVVVENVAALASRGLDTVLGDLSEAGYDAVWFDVRASDVGAPHRRERLFIVAWRRDVGDTAELRRDGDSEVARSARTSKRKGRMFQPERASEAVADASGRGRQPDGRGGGESLADAGVRGARAGVGLADPCGEGLEGQRRLHRENARRPRRQGRTPSTCGGGLAESDVGGDAARLPGRVDLAAHRWPVGPGEAQPEGEPPRVTTERRERRQRLKALGNAVVPQVAYVVGCVVAEVLRGFAMAEAA